MSDFNGRPIEGEINRFSEPPAPQDDPRLFLDALDKLLAVEGVEAVRWEQFTPYFNDGEACDFGTGDASVKLAFGNEGEFYEAWDLDGSTYNVEARRWEDGDNIINGHSTVEIRTALRDFGSVLGPKHYVVLNEKFGDPAQVTATKAGFEVEFYEHD